MTGKLIRWLSGARENTENDENFPVAAALAPTLVTVAVTVLAGSGALLYLSPELRPVEALYYSVVTVTTVGYGDYAPQTDAARAFITGYALFGTILLARSLAAIADIPLERRRKYQQQLVLDQCAPSPRLWPHALRRGPLPLSGLLTGPSSSSHRRRRARPRGAAGPAAAAHRPGSLRHGPRLLHDERLCPSHVRCTHQTQSSIQE